MISGMVAQELRINIYIYIYIYTYVYIYIYIYIYTFGKAGGRDAGNDSLADAHRGLVQDDVSIVDLADRRVHALVERGEVDPVCRSAC